MTGQEARDDAEIIGIPCANTEPHAAHNWQMSATGYCRCLGVQSSREARDDEREALIDASEAMTADEVHDHPYAALDKIRGLTRELRIEIGRKHPEPEITEHRIDAAALALHGEFCLTRVYEGEGEEERVVGITPFEWLTEEGQAHYRTTARAVLEAALRVPVGEGGAAVSERIEAEPGEAELAQALFDTLYAAGVSFVSADLIPRLTATVRAVGFRYTPPPQCICYGPGVDSRCLAHEANR